MTKTANFQLSLLADPDPEYMPSGDWHFDELGSNPFTVPNRPNSKLGSKNLLDPNSHKPELGSKNSYVSVIDYGELGSKNLLDPNSYNWQPPIGNLEQKPIKEHKYWYWRYYDNDGKKASFYLAKDYNKAVARALRIGIPPNAKPSKIPLLQTDPQTSTQPPSNLIDITSTARPTPRAA